MDKNFERRLLNAKNPRSRKHHKKPDFSIKFTPPKTHVEAFIQEIKEDLARVPNPPSYWTASQGERVRRLGGAMISPAILPVGLAAAAVADGVDAIKRKKEEYVRRKKLKQRRKYYETEAEKRRAKSEMVKAAVPRPRNPCPTVESLLRAYELRRQDDQSKIRFGKLLIDISEYARVTYDYKGARIIRTGGGMLNWLKEKCPSLAKHYQTCQRYKRLAQDYLADLGED